MGSAAVYDLDAESSGSQSEVTIESVTETSAYARYIRPCATEMPPLVQTARQFNVNSLRRRRCPDHPRGHRGMGSTACMFAVEERLRIARVRRERRKRLQGRVLRKLHRQ